MRIITKGATDQSVALYIVDNTTGLPVTDRAYNSSGIDLWYRREGAAVTSITEATQTASGAHSDGGFVHLANGVYRLDLPDAAVASGVDSVVVGGTLTGYNVYPVTIQLVAVNPQDTVRAGLTALPNAAAEASGGLYTRGTGAGQINQAANGMVDANVVNNAGTAITATSGVQAVNVTQFGGTNGTFSGGRAEVNTSHIAGSAVSTSTAQLGVNVVNFGGSAGTFASGRPEVNASHWGGTAVASATPNVNVAQISGDSVAADNAESFFDGTGYAGTNNVIPSVTTVTTTTTATNLTNAPTSGDLTATMKASVNAEVLDVLNTDTFAEPTGVPAATNTLVNKLSYLYMALRNKVTVSATKKTFFDDGDAAEWEKDLSDDGTTYTESEGNSI